jgi:tRNA pseudouridine55 synthase
MATGVLVLGVGKATRLLGHLALAEKAYDAIIRLGVATTTDDAEGEVLAERDASTVTDAAIDAAMDALRGEITQVPSSVSAIKVDGRRAYARVRAGEDVALPARPVSVSRFDLLAVRRGGAVLDLDVSVVCSSGTYVRALARDLGAALRVGGHLTALRRTRVGPYALARAHTLDQLADDLGILPLADAAAAAFPVHRVDAQAAIRLGHGMPLDALGITGPVAVLDPEGSLVALVQDTGRHAKPLTVFAAG